MLPSFRSSGTDGHPWTAALRRLQSALRVQHYSGRTVKAYGGWVRRFLWFHRGLGFRELRPNEATSFLAALSERGRVSPSTQNQARSALVFFFRQVPRRPLPPLEGVTPAARPRRIPVVLSRDEVGRALRELSGAKRLVAMLLYGSGLRLLEALKLRIKDIDFERLQIVVRGGKGARTG